MPKDKKKAKNHKKSSLSENQSAAPEALASFYSAFNQTAVDYDDANGRSKEQQILCELERSFIHFARALKLTAEITMNFVKKVWEQLTRAQQTKDHP